MMWVDKCLLTCGQCDSKSLETCNPPRMELKVRMQKALEKHAGEEERLPSAECNLWAGRELKSKRLGLT